METISNFLLGGAQIIIPFLIVLSIVIFVHEFGHFWVARRCGVKVLTFSIGFGRELAGWTDRHGTHWRVALIPLGGYVRMLGDADPASSRVDPSADTMSDDDRKVAFFTQKLWKRAAIVAAGPAFNFIFAILVYAGLYSTYGQSYTPPVIGSLVKVEAGQEPFPAEKAGFQVGDRIKSIDGSSIDSFDDLMKIVQLHPGQPMEFVIDREGKTITSTLTPRMQVQKDILGGEARVGLIGIRAPDLDKLLKPVIGAVLDDTPAAKAGFKSDDAIRSINGRETANLGDVLTIVNESKPGDVLAIEVERATARETMSVTVLPKDEEKGFSELHGFAWSTKDSPYVRKLGPAQALVEAVLECKNQIGVQLTAIGQMITGQRDTKDISGPITIARLSGKVANNYGITNFISLIAMISVAIGLFNLFPVPILDGGHLMFYAIEAVRGRPLGPRAMEYALRFGFALLVGLMIFATWNDILKLTTG